MLWPPLQARRARGAERCVTGTWPGRASQACRHTYSRVTGPWSLWSAQLSPRGSGCDTPRSCPRSAPCGQRSVQGTISPELSRTTGPRQDGWHGESTGQNTKYSRVPPNPGLISHLQTPTDISSLQYSLNKSHFLSKPYKISHYLSSS